MTKELKCKECKKHNRIKAVTPELAELGLCPQCYAKFCASNKVSMIWEK